LGETLASVHAARHLTLATPVLPASFNPLGIFAEKEPVQSGVKGLCEVSAKGKILSFCSVILKN